MNNNFRVIKISSYLIEEYVKYYGQKFQFFGQQSVTPFTNNMKQN